MTKPIFYDPQRKRWKRLRIIFDMLALGGLILGTIFMVGLIRMKPLPELLLASQKRNYRALANQPLQKNQKYRRSAHRKTDIKPSEVPLNSGEGLRAAYYVDDDPASYSSLRQHISQIDLLFPEWLHVISPDGTLTGFSLDNRPYNIITSSGVRPVDRDNKIANTIAGSHANVDILPLVNNYDPIKNNFMPEVGQFLMSDTARANFIHQVHVFLAANPNYRGLSLDLENIPTDAQPGFKALVAGLYDDFHPRNLHLYVNVPARDDDFDMKFLADHSDGLLVMNYDEHESGSDPGPIASQDWFIENLKLILKTVPKEKVICAIGSYGYDWTTTLPSPHRKGSKPAPEKVLSAVSISTQQAWQQAYDSNSQIDLDDDSLNVHFAYDDDDAHVRHYIWFLDAVTALNEMRAARALGIQTYALWRLGQEDNSMWKVWDNPLRADPAKDLARVPPGYDIDTEGEGDILRITRKPQDGSRDLTMDDDDSVPLQYRMVLQESMESYPLSYTVTQYGYNPKKVAISFDDGPDSEWTPKILDVLKKYNVKAVFLMIGEEAEKNVGIMQRVYREGHEIGNHTWTHCSLTSRSDDQIRKELKQSEDAVYEVAGVRPHLVRPPYGAINTRIKDLMFSEFGYSTIMWSVDPQDWRRPGVSVVTSRLVNGAHPGAIMLAHDIHPPTIQAVPAMFDQLLAQGYQFVTVSQLLNMEKASMPVGVIVRPAAPITDKDPAPLPPTANKPGA